MVLKHKDRGHSTIHPSVTQYVFMWCWRSTLDNPDPQRFLEELEQLLWEKNNQKMSAGSAISFFGFNIIYLYECLSLVIVSCSMQVKVRCKVVWQVVPHSSIHNMLKSRSVARSSGRLCHLHQYITCGITKKMRFRIGETLFHFLHQNKGVSCLWSHIKTIQLELVGEFWETSKMIVSPRRNARFWFYAPESRAFCLWNHINQNPIGTTTSNIIHDTPLITKTPRPDKDRVPSYLGKLLDY